MAITPIQLFKKAMENSKARIALLVLATTFVVGLLIVAYRIFTSSEMVNGSAQLTGIPQNIQSVPGVSKQNDQYLQTLLQSNREAADRAMQTGQTEIPTLAPTDASTSSSNYNAQAAASANAPCCCQTCPTPSQSTNDAGGAIAQLENAGAITPVLAGQLRQLQAEGITPDQYAQKLQQLVKAGQLTPAQAQALLTAYQAGQAGSSSTPQTPDALVSSLSASGDIDPTTAAAIKALDAQNLSPQDYATALNNLVKAGKLSPANAQKLLAAYEQAQGSTTPTTSALVDQLASTGAISPDTASALKALNAQNLTPDQYGAALNSLVQQGKLTPDQARQLLAAYTGDQQNAAGTTPAVATPNSVVDQLASAGAISPDTAAALKALNAEGLSPAAYANRLNDLVKSGQLTPEQARRLLASYQQQNSVGQNATPAGLVQQLASAGEISPSTASALNALNGEGLSPEAYQAALAKMVTSGQLTADQAQALAAAYAEQRSGGGSQIQQLIAAQQAAQAAQQQQALLAQQQADAQQAAMQQQQALQNLETAISSQASKIFTAWSPVTQSVAGSFADKPASNTGSSTNAADAAALAAKKPIILTGTILFAVLDTQINSDQPGPVLATIVVGKYKGAKLIGGLNNTPDRKAVIVSFSRMMMPGWPTAATINAVAINPQTARTALATDVDNHYLSRYGSVFATSFLQGLGQAVQNSGQTVVSSLGTQSQTFDKLSGLEQALVGLGQVGQSLGTQAQQGFNRPPTVVVKSGTDIGVLFQNDVTLPTLQDVKTASDVTKQSAEASQAAAGGQQTTLSSLQSGLLAKGEQAVIDQVAPIEQQTVVQQ